MFKEPTKLDANNSQTTNQASCCTKSYYRGFSP